MGNDTSRFVCEHIAKNKIKTKHNFLKALLLFLQKSTNKGVLRILSFVQDITYM
jgi:hypothetical protein